MEMNRNEIIDMINIIKDDVTKVKTLTIFTFSF